MYNTKTKWIGGSKIGLIWVLVFFGTLTNTFVMEA